MSDYVFTKPAPIKINLMSQSGAEVEVAYSFAAYLGEHVWSYAKWGDDGWDEAQARIGEVVEATADCGQFSLSLADTERLREANKAARISGQNAPRIRRMHLAIKNATPNA